MARRLFLDFDGTLIDSRRRQYELFVELTRGCLLTYDEYWDLKRSGINQREMLLHYSDCSDAQVHNFKSAWMDAIENPSRLKVDEVIAGVHGFLGHAGQEFRIYLVTGRQHLHRLMRQMQQLDIAKHFADVLNTGQRQSKADLVRSSFSCEAHDVFIGDTKEDILTGKELGIMTVGVTSGATERAILESCSPDLIVNSVAELDSSMLRVK